MTIGHLVITTNFTSGKTDAAALEDEAARRIFSAPGVNMAEPAPEGRIVEAILHERARQRAKGYTAEHDDKHDQLELADVVRHLVPGKTAEGCVTRENCIEAAAVLLAMVEKFDREAAVAQEPA